MSENYEFGSAVVDRIEGNTAILEFLKPEFNLRVPTQKLPDEIEEGSGVKLKFESYPEVANQLRNEIRELEDNLAEEPDESDSNF